MDDITLEVILEQGPYFGARATAVNLLADLTHPELLVEVNRLLTNTLLKPNQLGGRFLTILERAAETDRHILFCYTLAFYRYLDQIMDASAVVFSEVTRENIQDFLNRNIPAILGSKIDAIVETGAPLEATARTLWRLVAGQPDRTERVMIVGCFFMARALMPYFESLEDEFDTPKHEAEWQRILDTYLNQVKEFRLAMDRGTESRIEATMDEVLASIPAEDHWRFRSVCLSIAKRAGWTEGVEEVKRFVEAGQPGTADTVTPSGLVVVTKRSMIHRAPRFPY